MQGLQTMEQASLCSAATNTYGEIIKWQALVSRGAVEYM
jgi:hypothetical protein